MKITETAASLDTPTGRRITVTRRHDEDDATFLTIRDLNGPPDQEHGSARLTDTQAEWIARALLGIKDHHGLDEYAARMFAAHRQACHGGSTDGDCAACSIAVGAVTLPDLADLRARWANETQPYDEGGLLTGPRYVEQFAPRPDPYVRVLEQAAEINDLKADRDDALARATRAENRLARIRNAYEETQ